MSRTSSTSSASGKMVGSPRPPPSSRRGPPRRPGTILTMPPTTGYGFGDVILVPFLFTDQTGIKKRPAAVVSSAAYHAQWHDLIIMAVTSQIRSTPVFREFTVTERKKAGSIVPSVTKPILATIEKRLVVKKLGQLQPQDSSHSRPAWPRSSADSRRASADLPE
jgi:mRNA-degrading endonuclease toxin of MazEF toxin-antitoxin module